jgi:hypothetical protein
MRNIIKKILKEEVDKTINLKTLCDKLTVKDYDEVVKLVTNAIGTKEENPQDWYKIQNPLKNLKDVTIEINHEKKHDGMSGDSEPDEADTWWTAIQSTFCKR